MCNECFGTGLGFFVFLFVLGGALFVNVHATLYVLERMVKTNRRGIEGGEIYKGPYFL